MARDLDVDQQELEKFIEVLQRFQESTDERFKAVLHAWSKCDESWQDGQGNNKKQFTKDFEETNRSVHQALEAGEDAIEWLNKFNEIVKEFESTY